MANEYFEEHFPHRVNLLITFRERFGDPVNNRHLHSESYRDLFRCSKDTAMMMVRFFCEEVGLKLSQGQPEPEERKMPKRPFLVKKVSKAGLKKDPRYTSLVRVLTAANRAVAHIEDSDVYHNLSDAELIDAINLTEELVQSNIYQPNGADLHVAMKLPNNRM